MELISVDPSEYQQTLNTPYHVFNSAAFNLHNQEKADKVYYLLFKDKKYRLGIIAGVRGQSLCSPFSAPFGCFSYTKESVSLQYIEEAITLLDSFAAREGYKEISHVLPPDIYNKSFTSKLINTLYRSNYKLSYIDINYYFESHKFDKDAYLFEIEHNAQKNLKTALKLDYKLTKATNATEQIKAYSIISENRNHKGFPLRMTQEQVLSTSKIIPSDFFLLKHNDIEVAAAVCFHVAPNIVQVIYWGDLPGHSEYRPINILAYQLLDYYKDQNIRYIDVGPSTENGIPNYGLCEFKESIGCKLTPKYSFVKHLS